MQLRSQPHLLRACRRWRTPQSDYGHRAAKLHSKCAYLFDGIVFDHIVAVAAPVADGGHLEAITAMGEVIVFVPLQY